MFLSIHWNYVYLLFLFWIWCAHIRSLSPSLARPCCFGTQQQQNEKNLYHFDTPMFCIPIFQNSRPITPTQRTLTPVPHIHTHQTKNLNMQIVWRTIPFSSCAFFLSFLFSLLYRWRKFIRGTLICKFNSICALFLGVRQSSRLAEKKASNCSRVFVC